MPSHPQRIRRLPMLYGFVDVDLDSVVSIEFGNGSGDNHAYVYMTGGHTHLIKVTREYTEVLIRAWDARLRWVEARNG